MNKNFNIVTKPRLRRTKLDRSHERRLTADLFFLYPTLVEDCIPGDYFKLGIESVVRTNPLTVPIMHDIYMITLYFFVPYRLVWDQWEDFITGGKDGKFTADLPRHSSSDGYDKTPGSLWDHLGFNTIKSGYTLKSYPIRFPARAYNLIYNENMHGQ